MGLGLDLSTLTTADAIVQAANAAMVAAIAKGETVDDDALLELAVSLARANIDRHEGGPFGAVIADLSGPIPRIVGVGANHVVPRADPSAHAEVEAVRDAAARLGYSDLSGLTLFSSCECCPMCLAVANGAGISCIAYVATRDAAANAGFSDELQYRLCQLDDGDLQTHIADDVRDDILNKLDGHGAMVLDASGAVLAYGDADTARDPSAVASVQAVRAALAASGDVWLPEGSTLVSFQQPHLAGLMLADWARLLRPRDPHHPDVPERDGLQPNPMHVCFLNDTPEQIIVRDATGQDAVVQDASLTREQPTLPDPVRAISTARSGKLAIRQQAQQVFDAWTHGIEGGTHVRY